MKYMCMIAVFILAPIIFAQNRINGVIVDAVTNEPMINVNVYFTEKMTGTTTNARGEFQIDIPARDQILFMKMIGYQEEKLKVSSQRSCHVKVKMMPILVELESVMVTATRERSCVWDIPAFTSIISSSELEVNNPVTLGEALHKLTPASVMSYGNYGAMESLTLRGSTFQQVLVLWDGQRVNSPLSGGLDLSTVSLQSIQKIEIVNGGYSSIYGADAMAGVVNLVTQSPVVDGNIKSAFHTTMGSFGLQKHEATVQQRLGLWSYMLAVNQLKSENDFPYTPDNSDRIVKRANSDINARSLYAKVVFDQRRTTKITVSSELSDMRRGVPGSLTFPTVAGNQKDESQRHHLDIKSQPTNSLTLRFGSFLHLSKTHYQDMNPVYPSNSQNNASCPGLNFQSDLKIKDQTLILGGSWLQEQVKGSDVGQHKRTDVAIFSNGNFEINPLSRKLFAILTPSLRYDSFSDFGGQVNPRIGLLVSKKGMSSVGLRMSWSKAFRAPTFNDLYWPEDMYASGNRTLRPEHATSYDFGVKARLPIANGLEFDAGYFHKNITDLILWNFNSITGKSMPDNISAAAVDGAEMSLTIRSFSGRFNTEVNYTHLNALNKSGLPGIDGKKIPYRPIDSANFISSLKIRMVMISLCANYSGRRFVDDQNKQQLAPYMLVDGNFGIKPMVAGVQFDFMVSVKNIFDKQYLVVKDYPMPGRMWQVKVGMNI